MFGRGAVLASDYVSLRGHEHPAQKNTAPVLFEAVLVAATVLVCEPVGRVGRCGFPWDLLSVLRIEVCMAGMGVIEDDGKV